MDPTGDYRELQMDDAALLRQCEVSVYTSSGPGGQHRNKVSSAVRLRHGPTGIAAHGDSSRSQHANKQAAIRRLRMNIACRCRRPIDLDRIELPQAVAECLFTPRQRSQTAPRRLQIGPKDHRFWQVSAFLLDLLDASQGRLAQTAGHLGITTSNLATVLQSERHLLAAAQDIRRRHGQKRLL